MYEKVTKYLVQTEDKVTSLLIQIVIFRVFGYVCRLTFNFNKLCKLHYTCVNARGCCVAKNLRQGSEKLKELEEIMTDSGLFSEGFSLDLGDILEIDSDDTPPEQPEHKKPPKNVFPSIDGAETVAEFVQKYKKACLSRRTAFKDLDERWTQAKPTSGQTLSSSQSKRFHFLHVFPVGRGCPVCRV